jgi:hypothetical protein
MRHSLTFGVVVSLGAILTQPSPGFSQQGGHYATQGQTTILASRPDDAPQQSGQQGQSQQGQTDLISSPDQSGNADADGQQAQSNANQSRSPSRNVAPNAQQGSRNFYFYPPGRQPGTQGNLFRYYQALSANQNPGNFARWAFRSWDRGSSATMAPADEALRAQLKLPKDQGLIVTMVAPGSPEAAAGIEANDVLLQLEKDRGPSIALGKPEDLNGLKGAGDGPMTLVLLRRGQQVKLKVQPRITVNLGPVRPEPPSYWIGVSVGTIEPALRAQLQVPEGQGLIVINVVKVSPAATAGIQANDILLKLDGEDLTDQTRLIQIVQAKEKKTVPLEFLRAGKRQTVEITPQPRTMTWDEPKPAVFDFAYPGAINAGQGQVNSPHGTWFFDYDASRGPLTIHQPSQKEARDGDPTTTRRLDELSAQIKELRQAIDALSRAARQKE